MTNENVIETIMDAEATPAPTAVPGAEATPAPTAVPDAEATPLPTDIPDAEATPLPMDKTDLVASPVPVVSGGDSLDLSEMIALSEENQILLQELLEVEKTESLSIWDKKLEDYTVEEGTQVILMFVVLFLFVYGLVEGIMRW